jgi:hypothetical protein
MPRLPLLLALALAVPACAAPLVNGDFEDLPAFTGWVARGAVTTFGGLVEGSAVSAKVTGGTGLAAQQIGQNVDWGAEWWLDVFMAIPNAGANRAFNLMISSTVTASSNGGASINLRHQSGQWNTFAGGVWSGDLGLGSMQPSVDANADGDFDDPGDTRNVVRLRVTGHDWGTPSARYDLATSEANGLTFSRTVTHQTRFQNPGATTRGPVSFLFPTEFGGVSHYWVDRVTSHADVPADQPVIASFTATPPNIPAGSASTLSWNISSPETPQVTLTPGGPVPSGVTQTNVTPSVTTLYTLVATTSAGAATGTVTVAVDAPALPLRMSEFMAQNETTLEDEDGDDSDWIELHNPNTFAVNLGGYSLTDDPDLPQKWILPAHVLAPGAYLLVWASGKNRTVPGAPLHTNFQLASTGEYLALRAPSGDLQQEFTPTYPSQAADVSYGDGQFFGTPTPGAPNLPGPFLHDPLDTPQPDGSRVISLRADGAVSITMHSRVQYGAETAFAMTPTPDGRFTATLPAPGPAPGQMLRWRFSALDASGNPARLPVFLTPDAPEYLGAVMPDPALTSALPAFLWFIDPAHIAAADTLAGAPCSVSFLGEFYDNARVSLRGATTAGLEKKPHKFEFHDSRLFRFDPALPRVDEINLNAAYTDNSYLRDWFAMRDQTLAGVPAPRVAPVRLQRNGLFHSLAVMIENVDSRFLRRHGLDAAGPLYKATGGGCWLSSTAGFETRNGALLSELQTLVNGLQPANPARATYLFDQVDLPTLVSYLAANTLGAIYNPQKNYYLHRHRARGEWMVLPWDRDFAYGDIYLGAGDPRQPAGGPSTRLITDERVEHGASDDDFRGGYNRLFDAAFATPSVREMVYRRLRTLLDGPFSTGLHEAALDAMVPAMTPEAELDRAAWGFTAGAYRAFGTFPFTTAVARIRTDYLPQRRAFLLTNGGTPALGILPPPQPAHPPLAFGDIEANPASGNQDQEFIEIRNPGATALDLSGWRVEGAVVHTLRPGTVIPAGGSLFLTPSVTAFRARATSPKAGESRLVQGNYDGHLSNFGEELRLVEPDGTLNTSVQIPAAPTDLQRWLVISEIHFDPPGHPDAEFIELRNLSPSLTLDLSGARFTAGVDFTFPPAFTLAPGERVLVVYQTAAFHAAYPGNPARLAGAFASGRLSNSGERIKLDDAQGNTLAEVAYGVLFPWPAGPGSLTHLPGVTAPRDYSASEWRSSLDPAGTPGGTDATAWDGTLPVLHPAAEPLTFTVTRPGTADDRRFVVETSLDLQTWIPDASRLDQTLLPDGQSRATYRLTLPPGQSRSYVRVRVESRE